MPTRLEADIPFNDMQGTALRPACLYTPDILECGVHNYTKTPPQHHSHRMQLFRVSQRRVRSPQLLCQEHRELLQDTQLKISTTEEMNDSALYFVDGCRHSNHVNKSSILFEKSRGSGARMLLCVLPNRGHIHPSYKESMWVMHCGLRG